VAKTFQHDQSTKHHRHGAYATETSGLLFVALLLLILIIVRYWHAIHWSLR
jgi:Flp pilus assembly protein TadG